MTCINCGKCCTWTFINQEFVCKYLSGKVGEKTSCKIYETRLGTVVAKHIAPDNSILEIVCGERKNNPIKIAGCTEMMQFDYSYRGSFDPLSQKEN